MLNLILLNDSTFRRNFYEQMNSLIDKSNFKISFCAIMKDQYKDEYAHNLKDPYHVSFDCRYSIFQP